MLPQPYNKSTPLSGSRFIGLITAPSRGVACSNMNWHEYFIYNEETGNLIWKKRPREHFVDDRAWKIWNSQHSGKVAGHKTFVGKNTKPLAIIVGVHKRSYCAHRIIYEMHHGPIPEGMLIDHRDVNPFNNKRSNLRLATPSQNISNSGIRINNTSGYQGVCFNKKIQRYFAVITKDYKKIYLGSFLTAEEAHRAYDDATKKYHGEFARSQ